MEERGTESDLAHLFKILGNMSPGTLEEVFLDLVIIASTSMGVRPGSTR